MIRLSPVLVLCLLIFLLSCSSGKSQSVTTPDVLLEGILTTGQIEHDTNHSLLGSWSMELDIENLTATIVPNRQLNQHYNVVTMLPPIQILINSWDDINKIADVNVTIHNPFLLDAYDIRLIIFTDTAGHMLLNADDWTSLYDRPDGLIINPFKAYVKTDPNRKFGGNEYHSENLLVLCPNNNLTVWFAIDASFPGNCEEPYEICDFIQGDLYDAAGSSTEILVTVRDWMDNTEAVQLYCPDICGASLVEFELLNDDIYIANLQNSTLAEEGQYTGYIVASSEDSSGLCLYDQVTILVQQYTDLGWALTWGGVSSDQTTDVVVDNDGNIYVTGSFTTRDDTYENVDFDPGPGIEERWSTEKCSGPYT